MKHASLITAIITSTLLVHASARASIEFLGSGPNPEASGAQASGSAKFTITGNSLSLILTNTTAPRTTAQGNAMTGVAFNINGGSPVLNLQSIALTDLTDAQWTSKTASNSTDPPTGSWTTTLGASPLAAYGVATTGFNGRFNGGSISTGNASPDYGIVAAGTFNGTSGVAFGGSQFPFFQDSLTFTFNGVLGISESQIKDVQLLFGTDGTGIIPADPVDGTTLSHAPEATSLLIWSGLATAVAYGARRRKSITRAGDR